MPVVSGTAIYENVGKYARGAVLYAFERVGGAEGLAQWANENRDDFYTKLFPKVITREVDVTERRGIDELLDALDGDYRVVPEEDTAVEDPSVSGSGLLPIAETEGSHPSPPSLPPSAFERSPDE